MNQKQFIQDNQKELRIYLKYSRRVIEKGFTGGIPKEFTNLFQNS